MISDNRFPQQSLPVPDRYDQLLDSLRRTFPLLDRAKGAIALPSHVIESRSNDVATLAADLIADAEREGNRQAIASGRLLLAAVLWRRERDSARATALFADALETFEEEGNVAGMARTLLASGVMYFELADIRRALDQFQFGLHVSTTAPSSPYLPELLRSISLVQNRLGEFRERDQTLVLGMHVARQQNNRSALLRLLFDAGQYDASSGRLQSALERLVESASIARQEQEDLWYYRAVKVIGEVHAEAGSHLKAMEYLNDYLAYAVARGLDNDQSFALASLAVVHARMGEHPLALHYCQRARAAARRFGSPLPEANILMTLAPVLAQLGEYDAALEAITTAARIASAISSAIRIASCHQIRGLILCNAGRYPEAIPALRDALRWAQAMPNNEGDTIAELAHRDLALALRASGMAREAEPHQKEHERLQQKLNAEQQHAATSSALLDFDLQTLLDTATPTSGDTLTQTVERLLKSSHEWLARANATPTEPPPAAARSKKSQQGIAAARESSAEPDSANSPSVVVRTLGDFAVVVNGHTITQEEWGRKKARDVFKYLLLRHGRAVPAEELVDAIWENPAGRNLLPSLWNATSCIRKALEPGLKPAMASRYITIADGTYRLDLGNDSQIDFVEFRRLIAAAAKQADAKQQAGLLEQAVRLYHGDFFPSDTAQEWTNFERSTLKDELLQALMELASLQKKLGDAERAAAYLQQALQADAIFEPAWSFLLELHSQPRHQHQRQSLLQRCHEAYQRELGTPPPKHLVGEG
ncbi:MAG: tetratricopeptide repeat protein [Candidatus Kapabacteria bacterium]|nr:tetratricopeptide repeat protein [Candidatus Kapabacteria bacterium]